MEKIISFKRKSGKRSLFDFQEDIEDLHPFVTFIVADGDTIVSHITIPWCRIRTYDKENYEVRSCDCDGEICGHPPQRMYMDKMAVHQYLLTDEKNLVHLKFTYDVRVQRDQYGKT